jgi:hypothetical protein
MSESEWNEDDGEGPIEQPPTGLSVRRAVLGGVTGVALLVGPVALSQAFMPTNDADVEAADGELDTLFSELGSSAEAADELSQKRLNEALAAQDQTVEEKPKAETTSTTEATTTTTTTTTAPPATDPPTSEAPPPTEETPPTEGGGGLGDPYYIPSWDKLAECEAGGNWSINTGNGYYGGLQFSLQSWQAVGGTGYPHENSRETQIAMGQRLWEQQGWGAWPACTASFGWR